MRAQRLKGTAGAVSKPMKFPHVSSIAEPDRSKQNRMVFEPRCKSHSTYETFGLKTMRTEAIFAWNSQHKKGRDGVNKPQKESERQEFSPLPPIAVCRPVRARLCCASVDLQNVSLRKPYRRFLFPLLIFLHLPKSTTCATARRSITII